jgi:hypothetical protein
VLDWLHLCYGLRRVSMSSDKPNQPGDPDSLKNLSLYKEFQAEREEILRHKWLESEKAGYDIGFDHALTDWILKHRAKWRRARQAQMQHGT